MPSEKEVFDALRDSISNPNWSCVRGQKFTYQEAQQAQDFEYVVSGYCLEPEDLVDFIGQDAIMKQTGARMFLAENLPLENIGTFVLCETDDRIIKVVKAREEASKQNKG